MAIVYVTERLLHEGHSAKFNAKSFQVTRVFEVLSDALSDWPMGIRNAEDPGSGPDIPRIGAQHPTVTYMRVRHVTPEPVTNVTMSNGNAGWLFHVRVDYDTATDFSGSSNGSGGQITEGELDFIENPLERPVQLSWNFEKIQIAKTKCTLVNDNGGVDGDWEAADAIVNTAGQTFDPPLVDDLIVVAITLTRNESSFSLAHAREYVGAVNDDVWLGMPARSVKLDDLVVTRKFESNVWYWEHTYRLVVHPQNWDDVILNQGLAYIDAGSLKIAKDADDLAHGQPVRLDFLGSIITNPATASHYRHFRDTTREKPFDVLGIE